MRSNQPKLTAEGADYVRFLILSGPRTGSTVLAEALHSHPSIICFREIFNFKLKGIDYEVDGYDKRSSADMELRASDPFAFLRRRIYCRHQAHVRAVGFKFHYVHFWGYPGLWEALAADKAIRVIHLKRKNVLRMLLSYRIAEQTGVWRGMPRPANPPMREIRRKLAPSSALTALRQPTRAMRWLQRTLRQEDVPLQPGRRPEYISPEDFSAYLESTALSINNYETIFREHPMVPLYYEDLVADPARAHEELERFLGVKPQELSVSLRRQNPEPLSELIENYDALRAAFQDTPHAWMFDD